MSQGGFIDVGANNPDIATQYDGNAGSAIPQLNILNVVGSGGTTVTGSGNTLTINSTGISTPISVADGGTGRSSHTEYAVICGGTTTTAAQQSIASVGNSGEVLTSNGAGALPTFQAVSGGGAGLFPSFGINIAGYYNLLTVVSTSTVLGVTSSLLYLVPIFSNTEITIGNFGIDVITAAAGSTARLGIYSMDPSTGALTVVGDYGTVSTATTGVKTVTANQTITAGIAYFAACVVDENGGAVSLAGGVNSTAFLYQDSINTYLNFINKSGVSAGSAFASYAWADVAVNTGNAPLFLWTP